jgi:circadian clock protein KaiC
LGGGIPTGSLIMVVGAPGTGKTILLQQIAFEYARRQSVQDQNNRQNEGADETATAPKNEKILYFSTLSEPQSKMLQHLGGFSFFDTSLLHHYVEFLSLTSAMQEGLDAVRDVIIDSARINRSSVIIIDSFAPLAALSHGDTSVLRQFVYNLSVQLGMLGTTIFASIERTLGSSISEDELALADGIIGLYSRLDEAQERNRVEIRKLRGMRRLRGLHTYEITTNGLVFYPRFEELTPRDITYTGANLLHERLSIGMPELETMMGGGLTQSSSTIVTGTIGTGKTLMCLHFLLAGAARGERGLYIGFHESREELLAKGRKFDLDLQKAIDSGLITLLNFVPVQIEPDIIAHHLRTHIEQKHIKRVAFEGFAEVERVCRTEGRHLDFTGALVNYLKQHEVTAMYTHELQKLIGTELDLSETPFTKMAENLILLRHVEFKNKLVRILGLVKMRDSSFDPTIREFSIEDHKGINVKQPIGGDYNVLTGLARGNGGE